MKQLIRVLSMLVSVALLMTSVPASVLAETLEDAPELVIVQQESAPVPVEESAAEEDAHPEAELLPMEILPAEADALPAEASQDENASDAGDEAEAESQALTFASAIAMLNAQEDVQQRFAVEELTLHADVQYNLYEEGVLAVPAEGDTYTFTTTDDLIAYVDESGVLHTAFSGEVRIGLSVNGAEEVFLKVTVIAATQYPEFSAAAEPAVIGVGMKTRIVATHPVRYTYESDAVQLEADGTVTGLKPGEATISLTSANTGEVADVSVTVLPVPAPEQVRISAAEADLFVGEHMNLDAEYAEGTMCEFEYESSNPAVAEVDGQGNVTALAYGDAEIIVRDKHNLLSYDLAKCAIRVSELPYFISLSKSSMSIGKGDTYDLKSLVQMPQGASAELSYSTSDKKYVTVTEEGIIKGVKKGSATITVKTHSGLSAKIKVTVTNLATASKMKLAAEELTLAAGMTGAATVKFTSGYGGLVKYASSREEAARVDAEGAITAVAPGEATITVSLVQKPEVSRSMKVHVKAVPQSISVSVPELKLGVGQVSSAVFGVHSDDTLCDFIYETSAPDIAAVDGATGAITAVGVGSAEITVTAANNPDAKAICRVEVVRAPGSILLSESSLSIGKGDTYDLKPLIRLTGGSASDLTYATSNKKYVTVTADGVVKGVKKGSANITVTTHNGLSAKIKVSVTNLATASKIKLTPAELTLGVNTSEKLTLKFSSGYGGLYTLTSSDAEIASVEADGTVTGVKPGTASITLALQQKPEVSKSVTVYVRSAPETIQASVGSLTLATGQVSNAVFGVNPAAETTHCDYIYASSDPAVAAVDAATGAITALSAGKAEITITAGNNPAAEAKCSVTVVGMNTAAMILGVGDVYDLKARIDHPDGPEAAAYSFSTSAKKYVTVTEEGVLKGVKKGSANITVKGEDGLNVKFKVTVRSYASASKLKLAPAELTLGMGMTGALDVKFSSGYAGLYTLTSSRDDVARVDANGAITALAPGETVITATLAKNPGISASASVRVLPAPQSITASVSSLKLGVGQASTALEGVCPTNAMCGFIYASKNEDVALVDAATGAITAVGEGEAEITITASNNPAATAACKVQVAPSPTRLVLGESSLVIGKGDMLDLKQLILTDAGSCTTFSYSTSSKSYVAVTADGVIKGVKKGSATITVKTHNGLSAKIKVTVRNLATASKMKLGASELTLGAGMTGSADLKFTSGYGGLVKFTSDQENIAQVDANGVITALAAGEAQITATLVQKSTVSKTMKVHVKAAPEAITASVSSLKLGVGQVSSAVFGVHSDDTLCNFIYETSAPGIAAVDSATGAITAVGRGRAEITITASNNPAAKAVCAVEVVAPPVSIALAEESLSLGKGDTYDLKQLVRLSAGSAAELTYSTSSKSYVTVTTDGMIKGVKKGSATITVKTHNGLSAKIKVSVKDAPSKVLLDSGDFTLGVGMQKTLKVSFSPSASYSMYDFTSSNAKVASVDANGCVTALAAGESTITVETRTGKSAALNLTVVPATTAIEFAEAAYSLSEEMQQATALQVDAGSMDAYTYKSSDEAVVTIDENGVLTGVGKGTATITVVTHKGVSNQKECTVTVTPVPHILDFNGMPDMVIAKDYTAKMPQPYAVDKAGDLVPADFTYAFTKSAHSKIARIEGDSITGLAEGTVVVRVTSHNGKTIDFSVQVVDDAITGVQLAHSQYRLYIREGSTDSVALQGKVLGSKADFGAPTYRSSHPEIADVDENGVVTALSTGTAVITAEAYTGVSASCEIIVGTLTASVSFDGMPAAVTEGETLQLAPVFDPETGARMEYASSNHAVAVVDPNGLVTAIAPGSVTITGTTQNDLSAELALKVRAVPAGIYLKAAGLKLAAGESVTLMPEILRDASLDAEIEVDTSVTYATSDKAIADVDENGVVRAVAKGEAVITASTCNGLTAECAVTVLAAGSAAKTEFAFKTATIIQGDTAKLEFNLGKDAYERGFTLVSSDTDKLLVDDRNWTITATGAAPEGVTLSLSVNPPEGEIAQTEDVVSCTVKVLEKSNISFSVEEISLKRGANGDLEIRDLPEDLIGTFELFVEDEAVATYDAAIATVQAMDLVAETRVVCRVFDREIACVVRVLPTYRALIISEFNNSVQTASNLPFAQSNVDAMYESLYMSLIDGQTYDTTVLSSNPTQAQIESAFTRAFSGAKEGDVSLVYIVSHGYYNKDGIDGYCFGMPNWSAKKPDTYVTSDEIFAWLDGIPGNVILVLDSCKSGGFIRDAKAQLEDAGNIAVITAQAYNKNASYFVKGNGSSIEFMTYALCAGFGYDYENGAITGDLKADANGNGEVTIAECFKYTKSTTTSLVKSKAADYFKAGSKTGFLVPGVKTASQLKSWGGQTPQTFIPSSMEDLVIFAG